MKYIVGIDQGGTKCDVILGNKEGKIIDRHINDGYSSILIGKKIDSNKKFYKKCAEQLINYLNALLEKNHINPTDINALVVSCALSENNELAATYNKMLHNSLKIENILMCNDMISAFKAGTNIYPGGVIGMGTGTGIVFYPSKDKPVILTQNIKRQANRELGFRAFFHACYSAMQMLEPTLLSDYVCKFAETKSVSEALAKTNKCTDINALQFQHFVPYIYEAYLKNDAVAQAFIQEVALSISDCVRAGIDEMNLKNTPFTIVLNGGAFKGNGYIMEKLIKSNLADLPNITILQAEYEPIYGALVLAYEKFSDSVPQISNANEHCLIRNLN